MTCTKCIHHLVCAVYGPEHDDILSKGEPCSEFLTFDALNDSFKQAGVSAKEAAKAFAELSSLAHEHSLGF